MKKFVFFIIAMLAFTGIAFAGSFEAVVNPIAYIEQDIDYDDFTYSAGATGVLTLTNKLPTGAIPIAWRATVTTGWATSAVLLAGVSTDTDKFSASDGQNISAAGTFADSALGEAVGADGTESAQSVYLQITVPLAYSTVSAGSMNFKLYYLRP